MTSNGQHILPEVDVEFLSNKGYDFEEYQTGGEVHLIIHNFPLPPHYVPRTCDLLLKLPAGFPNANPDMFWTSPIVRLANGESPVAANVTEVYNGRAWQRWSRHSTSWRAGIDNLRSKIRSVKTELDQGR